MRWDNMHPETILQLQMLSTWEQTPTDTKKIEKYNSTTK